MGFPQVSPSFPHTFPQVITMLRHHLSLALVKAAHIVAEDRTKENIQVFVKKARIKIAKAIEPNE